MWGPSSPDHDTDEIGICFADFAASMMKAASSRAVEFLQAAAVYWRLKRRSHCGSCLLRQGRAAEDARDHNRKYVPQCGSNHVDPPSRQIAPGEVRSETSCRIHGSSLEGSTHRAPRHDVCTHGQR